MISIIIPAYKEEKWIADTIKQFTALSIPHEVIVSDGRSRDRTVAIATPLADRVLVYGGTGKHNAAIGRNDGAKVARGEYLVFLDSSSVIPYVNSFFLKALSFFENDPHLALLGVAQWISPESATFTDRVMLSITNAMLRLQNNVLGRGICSGKFMMMKKNAFKHVGGFREDLAAGEDGDMAYRLSKIGHVRIEKDLWIFYPGRREHALGWPKLLSIWTYNWFSVVFLHKAQVDEWKAIR